MTPVPFFTWRLERFSGSDADVFGGYGYGLILRGSDERTSGQMVCFSEEPPGTLVNGGDGRFIEGIGSDAGNGQVMCYVCLHAFTMDPLQMASGNDS